MRQTTKTNSEGRTTVGGKSVKRGSAVVSTVLVLVCVAGPSHSGPFPYDTSTSREASLFAAGSVTAGLGFVLSDNIEPLTPGQIESLDPADVHRFDREATRQWSTGAARASDVAVGVLLTAPVLLMVQGEGSQSPWTLATMYGQTLLLNNGLVYILKGTVARTRPFVYNEDPAIPREEKLEKDARRSFPSGHTANAFAAATFVASVYNRLNPGSRSRGWIWGGTLATASVAGYLRYRAGRHYPSDILAGALMGSAVGLLVPWLHEVDGVTLGSAAGEGGLQLAWGTQF